MKYKKEILSVLLGSLITGVITLSIGLFNLNKSFQISQRKELIYRLRSDISLLRKIEKELDYNLYLLLSDNYQPNIQIEKLPSIQSKLSLVKKTKTNTSNELMEDGQISSTHLEIYRVVKIALPKEIFSISAWSYSGPGITEINYELVEKINDTYRSLSHVNNSLESIWTIAQKERIGQLYFEQIEKLKTTIHDEVVNISNNKILNLKNDVSNEITRLNEKYDNFKKEE